jgi:hypothetical protein
VENGFSLIILTIWALTLKDVNDQDSSNAVTESFCLRHSTDSDWSNVIQSLTASHFKILIGLFEELFFILPLFLIQDLFFSMFTISRWLIFPLTDVGIIIFKQ